ncbi:MAG TPA: hypothetical protein VLL49_13180 [Anaerolineales bacterium]|nr:hypothetical protein [Anaerolineales bacterium]
MIEGGRHLGNVSLVQIQPRGLIYPSPSGEVYDPSRRLEVKRLLITPLGVEASGPDGERILDIHHMHHPDKAYDSKDLVSIGFSSHYEVMRARFGGHMVDGAAGENMIVECERAVWRDDLGQQIAVESAQTGSRAFFDIVRVATPCREFSHFAAGSPPESLPADELKSTLQFLDNGRRGFLLVLAAGQQAATVEPGDRVFAVHQAE